MSDTSETGRIVAPPGYRQRDYLAGWRACERDVVDRGQQIADMDAALGRATDLAERYGEAILQVQSALADDTLADKGKIMRARVAIASLGVETTGKDHHA